MFRSFPISSATRNPCPFGAGALRASKYTLWGIPQSMPLRGGCASRIKVYHIFGGIGKRRGKIPARDVAAPLAIFNVFIF